MNMTTEKFKRDQYYRELNIPEMLYWLYVYMKGRLTYAPAYSPALAVQHIVPLEPEPAMSTPTYDPFGTETTYKKKVETVPKWVISKNGHSQFWLWGDDMTAQH